MPAASDVWGSTDVTRRITNEPAYALHARPYRETSSIIDLLTREHGRLSVVARGARTSGRGKTQPRQFGRLLVGCSGKGQLLTLANCDSVSHRWLSADALYAGLYLNELLLRLLRDDDPHPRLFDGYEQTLDRLADGVDPEPALRSFERLLLKECGYELTLVHVAQSGDPIAAAAAYRYVPDVGFYPVAEAVDDKLVFGGATLLAVAEDDYADERVRRAAKQIMRRALAPHLGDKPLRSRALYRRAGATEGRRE
jgi:DNA repair protein RecO (recombination protein O)